MALEVEVAGAVTGNRTSWVSSVKKNRAPVCVAPVDTLGVPEAVNWSVEDVPSAERMELPGFLTLSKKISMMLSAASPAKLVKFPLVERYKSSPLPSVLIETVAEA